VACDFLVAVTVRFQVLFVFVVMEVGSRRIGHYNVTAHPTADWTLQQFRETLPSDHSYHFLIHDRDSIFLVGTGRRTQNLFRAASVAHAGASTKGKCVLRTASRNDTAGVSGFRDPDERAALTKNFAALGGAL
jgi:hypothetical protein